MFDWLILVLMSDVSWFKLLAFIIGGRSGVNVTSDGWFNVSL